MNKVRSACCPSPRSGASAAAQVPGKGSRRCMVQRLSQIIMSPTRQLLVPAVVSGSVPQCHNSSSSASLSAIEQAHDVAAEAAAEVERLAQGVGMGADDRVGRPRQFAHVVGRDVLVVEPRPPLGVVAALMLILVPGDALSQPRRQAVIGLEHVGEAGVLFRRLSGLRDALVLLSEGGTSSKARSVCPLSSPSPSSPMATPFSLTLEMTNSSGNSSNDTVPFSGPPNSSPAPRTAARSRPAWRR